MASRVASAKETSLPTRAGKQQRNFYVTRESQNARAQKSDSAKLSYVGMRNLTDLGHIDEQAIVSARGTIRGKKNRVRAGLANFENPKALEKLNTERGKVVVYVTSLRGVRSTFEECRYVLDLFHNLRVRVVTKDIYVYQFYHRELEERLRQDSGHANVPQVFIGGQHVGGKAKLEELNEVGELRKILEEYPRYETANNCKLCGGFEFIPCRKCGGSKNSTANKFTTEFRALRCTHCNENGMEGCPECEMRRNELEEELARKMMQSTTLQADTTTERHGELNGGQDGGELVADDVRTDARLKDEGEADLEVETENFYPETEPQDSTQQETDVTEELIAAEDGEERDTKGKIMGEVEKEAVKEKAAKVVPSLTKEMDDVEESEGQDKTVGEDIETEEGDSEERNTSAALTKYICDLDSVQF